MEEGRYGSPVRSNRNEACAFLPWLLYCFPQHNAETAYTVSGPTREGGMLWHANQ